MSLEQSTPTPETTPEKMGPLEQLRHWIRRKIENAMNPLFEVASGGGGK